MHSTGVRFAAEKRLAWTLLFFVALIAASLPGSALTHAAGVQRSFWIAKSTGWKRINCVPLWSSAHLQIYAPATGGTTTADARALSSVFESTILPNDLRLFGAPRGLTPVIVVLAPLDGNTLGYFNPDDELDAAHDADPYHSNHGNILYVRLPATMPDKTKMADTFEVVAHELQHLIEYRVRVVLGHLQPEEDWLNEGLSFYAQIANGYWTYRDVVKVRRALDAPGWPVDRLTGAQNFLRKHGRVAYGRAGMFASYLAYRFGPSFIHKLIASPQTGFRAIGAVLRGRSPGIDVRSLYSQWSVTEWLHGFGHLGYGTNIPSAGERPALKLHPIARFPYDSAIKDGNRLHLEPWGQEFVQFVRPRSGTVTFHLSGPSGALRVAAIQESSNHAVPPLVSWLQFGKGGKAQLRVNGYGQPYDRVTLAVSRVTPVQKAPGVDWWVRIRAGLLYVGNHD